MSFEETQDFASQVADLNKYGQALNQCGTVEEVVSLTLEAMSLLFELSDSTFVEVMDGDLRVVHSTNPQLSQGDSPSDIARAAFEAEETITRQAGQVEPGDSDAMASLAVPAKTAGEVTAILVACSSSIDGFDDEQIRPLEILASHAATAVSNIRSRERLERAHRDLETRKEMIELYDRLLRHDLGNDLQIIAGFADTVATETTGETADHARTIQQAAESAADLVARVGDLVSTLERQEEPQPRDLGAILHQTVEEVRDNYPSLTIAFDPEGADYRVYGGELLDSVFTNILTNAAVHNDEPVTVDVTVEPTGTQRLTVTFADDGSGIPPEIRDGLFEMGKKGPDSSGSGFGLGFVRALTESYGGTVSVDESEAGGAAFHVTLERV